MAKIIHIANSDYGYSHTIAVASEMIIDRLYKNNSPHELIIFARSAPKHIKKKYKVTTIGLGRFVGRLLKFLHMYVSHKIENREIEHAFFNRQLAKALYKMNPHDICVIHSWSAIPHLLAPLKEKNPKIILISDKTMTETGTNTSLYEAEEKIFDVFLSPSDVVSNSLIERGYSKEKIAKIPYGTDPLLFKPMQRQVNGTFKVVFAGEVGPRKGIIELIHMWKKANLSDATLTLFGRVLPEILPYLEDKENFGIFTPGFCDLTHELPKHHLLVLPSHIEGSAKVQYEALACGLPLLASPQAGSVITSGIEGFIIEVKDCDLWVEKLRFFYENRQEIEAFGKRARDLIVSTYSWDHFADRVITLYLQKIQEN